MGVAAVCVFLLLSMSLVLTGARETGAAGETGHTGRKGTREAGETGHTWRKGTRETGETGHTGRKGTRETGETGHTGRKGTRETGDTGLKPETGFFDKSVESQGVTGHTGKGVDVTGVSGGKSDTVGNADASKSGSNDDTGKSVGNDDTGKSGSNDDTGKSGSNDDTVKSGSNDDTGKSDETAGVLGPTGFLGRLLVVPMDGSHWVDVKFVAEEMGRRGHQVTVVIPEVSMRMGPSKHYTTVSFPVPYGQEFINDLENQTSPMLLAGLPLLEKITQGFARFQKISGFFTTTAESLLFNTTLIEHLSQQGFDAVLTDPMIPTGSLIARRLGLPSVNILRGIPCGLDMKSAACPSPPSYVPRFFTLNTDKMNFKQRVINVLVSLLEPLMCKVLFWQFDTIASNFLGGDVGVADVLADSDIWLMRFDFTLEFPRPLMPNMVLVGGINCDVRNPLPDDLESWVSSDQHGFVVFTLGSMVSSMPEEITKVFLAAFKQIPQKVLWRYTGPVPDNDVPDNVKMMKWVPQNDLLAHPGARAFLTHGGSHGLYEGVCHAVPMVMLPLAGDQPDNAHRMAARGVGVVLDIYHITVASLVEALNDVINNTRYKDNALKLSALHKDRPVDPLDLSVYWTEFVMRHKGARHLRPAAHDLHWFQYHSLDVIGLLAVVVMVVVMVTVKCMTFCVRRVYRKRKQD